MQDSLAIEGNALSTKQMTRFLMVRPYQKEVQEMSNAIKAYESFQQWQPI